MDNTTPLTGMFGYKAFYNGKTCEIWATSMLLAKTRAINHWKVPKNKQHMVSVVLCERPDGTTVVHSPSEL